MQKQQDYREFVARVKAKHAGKTVKMPDGSDFTIDNSLPDDVMARTLIQAFPWYDGKITFDGPAAIGQTPQTSPQETSPQTDIGPPGVGAGEGFMQTLGQNPAAQYMIGLAKSPLSTGRNLYNMVTRTPLPQKSEDALAPENQMQAFGKVTGDALQYAIPETGIGKAVTYLEKMAPAIKGAGTVLGLFGKTGLQSLSAGAVAKAQGATNEEALNAGEFAGSLPLIGGLGKIPITRSQTLGDLIFQHLPRRMVETIIRPVKKEMDFGRNPGGRVVDENIGLNANTMGGLKDEITSLKQRVGTLIDNKLSTPQAMAQTVDLTNAINGPIDAELQKAASFPVNIPLHKELSALKEELNSTHVSVPGISTPQRTGPMVMQMSPANANNIKVALGEATNWHDVPYDKELNQVRVAVYRNIANEIENKVPGMNVVNARYADLLTAEKALQRNIQTLASRYHLLNMRDIAVGMFSGGAGGYYSSASAPETMLSALGGALVSKALGSTPSMIYGAKALANAPRAVQPIRNARLAIMDKGNQ